MKKAASAMELLQQEIECVAQLNDLGIKIFNAIPSDLKDRAVG